MPDISSLRGHGHFHFANGTSIGNLMETFEGTPRPRLGAVEAKFNAQHGKQPDKDHLKGMQLLISNVKYCTRGNWVNICN